ncbi:hypothetical protein [Bacillus toyonensis]|uniref:Uncharacterized protein n=1 Tax=Bacillus toyonensis TaxID=155322 RepID=A0A2A8HDI4_9BACI|nr:hypothetical protein [Bacillus toyonensis]PEQ04861.1 hypothetical protein CN585_16705 [Bacillus toyonensis]
MRLWLTKNRRLFIIFGIISLLTLIITLYEMHLIMSNVNDLQAYATNNVVSDNLKTISLLGLFDITLFTAWICMFIFIFLKMVFPSKQILHQTLFIGDLKFLKNIPNELRKGFNKNA